jgi:hypothetical protein
MEIKLNIQGEEMQHAQLELLMKILSEQKLIFAAINIIFGKDQELYPRVEELIDNMELPDPYEHTGISERAVQDRQLNMLAEILASVQVTGITLVDCIAKSQTHAREVTERMEFTQHKFFTNILEDLWARRGTLDINEISKP